jgi:hypothetical protein
MTAATVAGFCPVCLRPAGSETPCPDCGWQLTGELTLGAVSGEARASFDHALARAQAEIDLSAVLLAAGFPGPSDRTVIEALAPRLRGGHPDPSAWEAARARLAGRFPGSDRTAAATAVAQTLDAITVPAEQVVVLEVGETGVTTGHLSLDQRATPAPGRVQHRPWSDLLPAVPRDDAERRALVLAGALTESPSARQALEEQLLADQGDLVSEIGGPGDLVLLMRTPGWAVPERFLAGLLPRLIGLRVSRHDVGREGTPLTVASFGSLLAATALRTAYSLVVADVDPSTREVRLRAHELFPAGRRGGDTRPVGVDVIAPGARSEPVVVAVVAASDRAATTWPPISVHQLDCAAGSHQSLQIDLLAPGRLQVTSGGIRIPVSNDVNLYHRAVTGTPREYESAAPLDVIMAVELAGAPERVSRRLDLIEQSIARIHREHLNPSQNRYGVVGYVDHSEDRYVPVIHPAWPLDRETVIEELQRLRRIPVRRSDRLRVAPLEDALEWISHHVRWQPGAKRNLVMFGARPPYPSRMESIERPGCPGGLNWRMLSNALRTQQAVRCVSVWDQPEWFRPINADRDSLTADDAWHSLCRGAVLLSGSGTDQAAVARSVERPKTLSGESLLFPLSTGLAETRSHGRSRP